MRHVFGVLRTQLAASHFYADLDDALPVADCIEDIANTLTHLGDWQSAAQLLGYTDAVRLRTASPMNVGLRAEYDGMVARTRAALGLRFAMLHAAGTRETLPAVMRFLRRMSSLTHARLHAQPYSRG